MSLPSEYLLKILWFAVPDSQGRSRSGVLCGVTWKGEWPIAPDQELALLPEAGAYEEVKSRFRHPSRRSQSVLGRFALSELKLRGGPAISEMSFSISHSGRTAVALGFEDESCGVDLELGADQNRSIRVFRKFLSGTESALFEAARLSPWAVWCAKEALGKSLGSGLVAPLSQYEVRSVEAGVLAFSKFSGPRAVAWDLRRGGEQSAHLAICLPGCENKAAATALRRLAIHEWFSAL